MPSMSSKLPPAENALPAPCSTTANVSGSRSTASHTSASWRCIAGPVALSPGPSSVIRSTCSAGRSNVQVREGGVAVGVGRHRRHPCRSSRAGTARRAGLPCSRTPMDPDPNILILCTGNATRSVIAGAVLKAHLPHVEIATGGTMSIDGLPMSWRTKAGFEAVGVTPPSHRSRQVLADGPRPGDADRRPGARARQLGAPHARRGGAAHGHAEAARRRARRRRPPARRARRRARAGRRRAAARGRRSSIPGGGEVEAFIACAQEVVPLVDDLAARLRLAPAMADWGSEDWTGDRATRWVEMADAVEGQLAPVSDELFAAAALRRGRAGARRRAAAPVRRPGGRPSSSRPAASSSAPTCRPR